MLDTVIQISPWRERLSRFGLMAVRFDWRFVCETLGLTNRPRFDGAFITAVLAGPIFWLVLYLTAVPVPVRTPAATQAIWFMTVIWYPVIEELLFRGLVQGELRRFAWGQRIRLGISGANAAATALFVIWHLVYSPEVATLTVVAPSLVFGYLRDRDDGIYTAIFVHAFYNATFLVAVPLLT